MIIFFLSFLYLGISLLAAGHALLNKRDPRSALGWTACCLFIPYLGPLLYLLAGINRNGVRARRQRPIPDDKGVELDILERPSPSDYPLSIIGINVTGKNLLPCTGIQFLENGEQSYPAMLEAINQASSSVYLSTYIFANDCMGEKFINALAAAQQRGVKVKVIVDGMGEYMSFPRIGRKILKQNLPFMRFNPIKIFPFSVEINMRNHRKLLVTDGTIAFTGGMNIAAYHLVDDHTKMHKEQDMHFKLSGPIVADLEYAFLKDWDYCSGEKCANKNTLPVFLPPAEIWARLIIDGPNEYLDKLSDVLNGSISAAKSRVWLMTPYFLPDAEISGALQAAKLRNIDVKIVLPAKNNIPISHWATKNTLWQLLDHNIEIYYQAPPFSHAKLLIIDDHYSLIGSANIDPRSLRLNFELGVELFSRKVNQDLQAYFEEKIKVSTIFKRSNLVERSLFERLRDAAAWLFSPYL